jgi:hypothetical protein
MNYSKIMEHKLHCSNYVFDRGFNFTKHLLWQMEKLDNYLQYIY